MPLVKPRTLLVASFPHSILEFRGPLIDALRDRGMDVHVAVPDARPGSAPHDALVARGLTVHAIALDRTGLNPLADLRVLYQLWRLMRSIRPTLVLGYTIKPVVYGSIAAWLARVPRRFALITGLGYTFLGDGGRPWARRLAHGLYAVALARVHKVFFQNADDLALFRGQGILPEGMPAVVVDGSGVDLAAYPATDLPEGPPSFLMIGRLLGDKGVREYAAAARQLRAEGCQARFRLVGWIDGNPDAIGQSELDAWIADGSIDFGGRLADVRPEIARCTAYVLPSYREGMPRTVLEAMAMGRPIVTTDAPGCRETVEDGVNGFLVPVRSVEGLAGAMRRFIETPAIAAGMGRRSRQIAEARYDAHRVSAVILSEMGVGGAQACREAVG